MRVALALLLSFAVAGACAGETGYLRKAGELRDRPQADGKVIGQFTAKESVEILARQGGWMQVKGKAAAGWVRLAEVRLGVYDPSMRASAAAASTAKSNNSGIRGFSEEELTLAAGSASAAEQMKALGIKAADARAFAARAGLKPRKLDYDTTERALGGADLPADFFDDE